MSQNGEPTNRQELDALHQLLRHPGWQIYTLRVANLQQALVLELQDDLRKGRMIEARIRQFVLDMVTKILEMPEKEMTALEIQLMHEMEMRGLVTPERRG